MTYPDTLLLDPIVLQVLQRYASTLIRVDGHLKVS